MKSALTSFTLFLLLTACSHRDDARQRSGDVQLRSRVAGTWLKDGDKIKGMLVLSQDGSFSAGYTNFASIPTRAWTFEGKWEIADGVCVSKLTKSQSWGITNHQTPGKIDHFKILRVDDASLVWESEGQTIAFTRSK